MTCSVCDSVLQAVRIHAPHDCQHMHSPPMSLCCDQMQPWEIMILTTAPRVHGHGIFSELNSSYTNHQAYLFSEMLYGDMNHQRGTHNSPCAILCRHLFSMNVWKNPPRSLRPYARTTCLVSGSKSSIRITSSPLPGTSEVMSSPSQSLSRTICPCTSNVTTPAQCSAVSVDSAVYCAFFQSALSTRQ